MKLKLNAVVAVLAALAAAGANATITQTTTGGSSLLFVARDNTTSTTSTSAALTTLTIDLGPTINDFLAANSVVGSAGSLSAPGTTVVWDFKNNTRTINGGAAQTAGIAWSGAFNSFVQQAQVGITWGVIGADNANAVPDSILNFNLLGTGTPTQTQINNTTSAGAVNNGAQNVQNFIAASGDLGNHASVVDGANLATAGDGNAFLTNLLKNNFGGQSQWSYLVANGGTTRLNLTNQAANPVVYQLGSSYGVDSVLSVAQAATFTFDSSTGVLTYLVPVPEPGTYGLMFAGLAAVGFMVRRRATKA